MNSKIGASLQLLLVLALMLSACNPKPEPVQGEDQNDLPTLIIQYPDKLYQKDPVFSKTDYIMQGFERIGHYYDISLSQKELEKIFYSSVPYDYFSYIDAIQLFQQHGVTILPQYGTSEKIIEELKQGVPVLARFTSDGSIYTYAIFYGMNDTYLFYYHLSGMKDRKISIERLQAIDTKLINLYLVSPDQELLDSELYFNLYATDAFIKGDIEMYRLGIERLEQFPELFDRDSSLLRFYAYFYTLIEPQPNKVEPFLHRIDAPIPSLEINFIHQLNVGNREKAIEMLGIINIGTEQLASYRKETLYHIIVLTMEEGLFEAAEHAWKVLQKKDPNYPELQFLLLQIDINKEKFKLP